MEILECVSRGFSTLIKLHKLASKRKNNANNANNLTQNARQH